MKTNLKLVEVDGEKLTTASLVDCISARELYLKLGNNEGQWSRWNKKNIINNEMFIENRDWIKENKKIIGSGQPFQDFLITPKFALYIKIVGKNLRYITSLREKDCLATIEQLLNITLIRQI